MIKFCRQFDVEKISAKELQNDIYHRSRLCRAPNSEKVKRLYLLNWVEYFDKLLRKHWYWQDLAQEIANWHFYRSRLCRAPNSEKVKMTLSLELWRILWWNFAYTLILTRCRMRLSNDIWDRSRFCRGSNSEKSEIGPIPWTFWYILIKFWIPITIDMI